jgi:hypothetical protein
MKLTKTLLLGIFMIGPATRAQDPDADARQQAARDRELQVQAAREVAQDKSRATWYDSMRRQSESNLELAIRRAEAAKREENENKFGELKIATAQLLAASERLDNQVNASGSQAISVTFYSDLDQIEKLVKRVRAAAK